MHEHEGHDGDGFLVAGAAENGNGDELPVAGAAEEGNGTVREFGPPGHGKVLFCSSVFFFNGHCPYRGITLMRFDPQRIYLFYLGRMRWSWRGVKVVDSAAQDFQAAGGPEEKARRWMMQRKLLHGNHIAQRRP